MNFDFIIYGSGGHARVVLETAYLLGLAPYLVDDDPKIHGRTLLDNLVHPFTSDLIELSRYVHVAIGNNQMRMKKSFSLQGLGFNLKSIIHPHSRIASSARLGIGCFVAAGSVVGPSTHIGDGVIINHNAVVDHECRVGCWSHIAPNSTLGGNVHIHESTLIGSGSVVLPSLTIGHSVIVGAGSVVTKKISSDTIVLGNPASPR